MSEKYFTPRPQIEVILRANKFAFIPIHFLLYRLILSAKPETSAANCFFPYPVRQFLCPESMAHLAQVFRSILSLARAYATGCHCVYRIGCKGEGPRGREELVRSDPRRHGTHTANDAPHEGTLQPDRSEHEPAERLNPVVA